MVFRKNKVINGVDRIPFIAEFFRRKVTGPIKKNLVVPKEAANMLTRNVNRGNTELNVANDKFELPYSSSS